MKRYTTFIDGEFFHSLADIDAHSKSFAVHLAEAYAIECARLYVARHSDAYTKVPPFALVMRVVELRENMTVGDDTIVETFPFDPSELGEDELSLKTLISIPGVFPIPLNIKAY